MEIKMEVNNKEGYAQLISYKNNADKWVYVVTYRIAENKTGYKTCRYNNIDSACRKYNKITTELARIYAMA